jgi:hypothetical protein
MRRRQSSAWDMWANNVQTPDSFFALAADTKLVFFLLELSFKHASTCVRVCEPSLGFICHNSLSLSLSFSFSFSLSFFLFHSFSFYFYFFPPLTLFVRFLFVDFLSRRVKSFLDPGFPFLPVCVLDFLLLSCFCPPGIKKSFEPQKGVRVGCSYT